MHVSLTPTLEDLIRKEVESGLYNNASEVVREALRLMQEHDEVRHLKVERLREALANGEADLATGRFTTIENDEELEAFFAHI